MATELGLIKSMLTEVLIRMRDLTANDQFMTLEEAAEYLKVSESQFKVMLLAAAIPRYKYGRIIRVRKKHLDEWLETQKI